MQNYWLDERLVTTFGHRDDTLRTNHSSSVRAAPSGPTALYDVGE
ncbi:MAG: hypothetical protein ACREIA_23280 [Opitutaceae bacterium]